MLATAFLANGEEDSVHTLLKPLVDLSIDTKEAINQVSRGVLNQLNLDDSEANQDIWVKLLTKQKVDLGQGEDESDRTTFDILSEELDHQVESLKAEIGTSKDSFKHVIERLVQEYVHKATHLLQISISSRIPALCQSGEQEDTELLIDKSMADQFPDHLFGVLDQLDNDLSIGSSEEEINELVDSFANAFDDVIDAQMQKAQTVLSFCRFPKDLLLITGQVLLAKAQTESHVPLAQRASRLAQVCQLLTLFQLEDGRVDQVQMFINELSLAHQNLVKSPEHFTADFQELLAVVIGDFIVHIDARVSSEMAFKWAKQLLTRPMLSNADHLTLFMKGHIQRHQQPLLSTDFHVNSKQNLFTVAYLVSVGFNDINKEWLSAAFKFMPSLLKMNHQLLKTWSSMSVMLHEDLVTKFNDDAFMDLVHKMTLEFLDTNGLKVDDGNWNVFFDKFINAYYSNGNLPIIGTYFILKVYNVHFYTDLPHFDLVFFNFASDAQECAMLAEFLRSDSLKMIRAIAWNAYKSIAKDDSAEALRSGKYLLAFANQNISSEHFQKAGITQEQLNSNQQRPPRTTDYGKIIITFTSGNGKGAKEGQSVADATEQPAKQLHDLEEEEPLENVSLHKIVVDRQSVKRSDSVNPSEAQDESNSEYNESEIEFDSVNEVEDVGALSPALRRSASFAEDSKKKADKLKEKIEEIFDKSGSSANKGGEHTLVVLGELQPEVERLIEEADLDNLLRLQNVFGDEQGGETEVILVKFVPKNSDCHERIFGARK